MEKKNKKSKCWKKQININFKSPIHCSKLRDETEGKIHTAATGDHGELKYVFTLADAQETQSMTPAALGCFYELAEGMILFMALSLSLSLSLFSVVICHSINVRIKVLG